MTVAEPARGNKSAGILVYVLGLLVVLASWIGAVEPVLGWGGFAASAVGISLYRPKQPKWVNQVGWVLWGIGMMLIIAGNVGAVTADLAWMGLILTFISGSVHFIDFD